MRDLLVDVAYLGYHFDEGLRVGRADFAERVFEIFQGNGFVVRGLGLFF